jgi:hypothetical protein
VKRFAPVVLQLCLLLAAAPLVAQDARPQFNIIVVKHFTNAGKVSQPQDFIHSYSAGLIGELQSMKIANQVVAEGVPVAAADAAGSIMLEGKFIQFDKGGMYATGKLDVLINVYRISDGVLVKTISTTIPFKPSPKNTDQSLGQYAGGQTAILIQQNLRKIALPTLSSAFPAANHPAPSPAPAAAAPSAAATPAAAAHAAGPADVEISTEPSEAAIFFDGIYQGSTPSLIELAPGTHEITIKKRGFADWRCKLNVTGGSIHLNAELQAATPQ